MAQWLHTLCPVILLLCDVLIGIFLSLGDPSFAKVFIEAILQRLMSGDEEGEAVRVTSETLLLLFICERENLQHHLRQLISSIGCYPSMDNDIHAFMQFHEKRDRDLKSSKTQEQFQEQLFAFVKNLRSMTRRH